MQKLELVRLNNRTRIVRTRYDKMAEMEHNGQLKSLSSAGIISTQMLAHYERAKEFKNLLRKRVNKLDAYALIASGSGCATISVRRSVYFMRQIQ